jgi:sugar phosphate isomerase/epimerase
MKKVSIGSWAYVFGAFAEHPILLPELCEKLRELKFDGISMGGFKPHANPELYDTPQKRQELKDLLKKHNLEVADFACDLWSLNALRQPDEWVALFETNAKFAQDMGWKIIRVDTGAPPVLEDGMTYARAYDIVLDNFRRIAKTAQNYGLDVVWEFEPGFIVNEPKNIVKMCEDVGAGNFSVLFDTCHGHMSAVKGARHLEQGCALPGGLTEFIEMLKGKIGVVHVIDSDGTLNGEGTSTHAPFGLGDIDFDTVIPALLDKGGYKGDWWAIDLCEWPDAWRVTAECKAFVDRFNSKYSG